MNSFDACWLPPLSGVGDSGARFSIQTPGSSPIVETIKREIAGTYGAVFGDAAPDCVLKFTVTGDRSLGTDGFWIRGRGAEITLEAESEVGLLYALFRLYRASAEGSDLRKLDIADSPKIELRVVNNWDNLAVHPFPVGSIERGYAGNSIFYEDGNVVPDKTRLNAYARLLASVGINAITINNCNVLDPERYLITDRYLRDVSELVDLFGAYGIRVFVSIDFAAPVTLANLDTADPEDARVQRYWEQTVAHVYDVVPRLGGFQVKADSEGRPGPADYGRTAAQGANMLARALRPHRGLLFWRAFVYNTENDWRDRTSDRARAAYDYFKPQDGQFDDNVILQVKNGPMDFQVREPVSPLLGGLPNTNTAVEFEITQEYTGQQIHVCYLVPQWKDVLDFDTLAAGRGSTVARIISGERQRQGHPAIVGVSNIGSDENWCGHKLAQANLYGFARLAWDPALSAEQIAHEWIRATFGREPRVCDVISEMLRTSWETYEKYTAPLGVGWMCDARDHFSCDVDGHEYGPWGACHYADREGIGAYRARTGSAFVDQYAPEVADIYDDVASCPDKLLLFFHHVPFGHVLHSGKTLIQHVYDAHFEGVEQVARNIRLWHGLRGLVDEASFTNVETRLRRQHEEAVDWRDKVNAYFYRKSGIPDAQGRDLY